MLSARKGSKKRKSHRRVTKWVQSSSNAANPLERQNSPPFDSSVNGHKESLLDTSSSDSNRVVNVDNYSSAESQSKVASLMKPIHVGAGVAPRKDPPNNDHYQSHTGPTAALSGSKTSEQSQNNTDF